MTASHVCDGALMRAKLALALAVGLILGAGPAAAADDAAAPLWDPGREVTSPVGERVREPRAPTDGVYGRFSGDLDFGLGAGAELDDGSARGAARFSVHYFSTAGVYATYRDALGSDADTSARAFSLGVDLRPAFIPRWSKNMQQGPSFLDLSIDSISLAMGAFWAQPKHGSLTDQRGFETSLGFGVPLFGQATGPWLESRAQLAFSGMETARAQFLFLLSFHALAVSPLARAQ